MSMIDVVACPFKNPRREKPRSAVGTNCRRALGLTALLQLFFLCPLLLYYPKYWRCGPNVQHMKAGARHSTCIFPTNSTFTANDSPTEQARGRTPSGRHRQANTSRLGLSQERRDDYISLNGRQYESLDRSAICLACSEGCGSHAIGILFFAYVSI